jgi:hypothetical protein
MVKISVSVPSEPAYSCPWPSSFLLLSVTRLPVVKRPVALRPRLTAGLPWSWADALASLREPYYCPLGWVCGPGIRARAPIQGVVGANPISGVERIVAILPVQLVGTCIAFHLVSPAAEEYVVASPALDDVVAPMPQMMSAAEVPLRLSPAEVPLLVQPLKVAV